MPIIVLVGTISRAAIKGGGYIHIGIALIFPERILKE
jgi:hypothetical protein